MSGDTVSGDSVDYFHGLGPWATAEAAADYLHIATDDLRQMVDRNEVIGVRFADGQLYFPTWQFNDGAVLDGVGQVLGELMPALRAPEACAAWLTSTVYENGLLRRIDELRAGRLEHVLRDAVRDASRICAR